MLHMLLFCSLSGERCSEDNGRYHSIKKKSIGRNSIFPVNHHPYGVITKPFPGCQPGIVQKSGVCACHDALHLSAEFMDDGLCYRVG